MRLLTRVLTLMLAFASLASAPVLSSPVTASTLALGHPRFGYAGRSGAICRML